MSIIASIGEEELGGEKHLVVYFRGKQKALVLNKTNASYLATAISDETDDWPGHEIVLYPTKVNFQGKMVDAIRVEMPAGSAAAACRSRTPMPRRHNRRSMPDRRSAPTAVVRVSTTKFPFEGLPYVETMHWLRQQWRHGSSAGQFQRRVQDYWVVRRVRKVTLLWEIELRRRIAAGQPH